MLYCLVYYFYVVAALLQQQKRRRDQSIETASLAQTYWIATWSQAQKGLGLFPINDNGHTVEYEIDIQNSGEKIKLSLGNYYSEESLDVQSVCVSKEKDDNYVPVSVEGAATFSIAPEGLVKTDEIDLHVEKGDSVYIRIYYPEQDESHRAVSGNQFALEAERSIAGDFSSGGAFEEDSIYIDPFTKDAYATKYAAALEQYPTRYTMTIEGIDVATSLSGGTIVAFGDSITEQSYWTTPTEERISSTLGEGYQLVNAGISGNRLLKEISILPRRAQYFGVSAVERFNHDVFEVNENVTAVIISIGINDLHQPGTEAFFSIEELPTFEEMVEGYETLISEAKSHNSRVFLATLTPFIGYTVDVENDKKEALRQEINEWIRQNEEVDGVYDFDQVVAEPDNPTLLSFQYDSGDHLHPSEIGGEAMSQIIQVEDLRI